MAKVKKIGFKKVKKVSFKLDLNGSEQSFEYTELSTQNISDLSKEEFGAEAQHEMMIGNTICTTEGLTEEQEEEALAEFSTFAWEELPPGEYWNQMQIQLGNDNKKK